MELERKNMNKTLKEILLNKMETVDDIEKVLFNDDTFPKHIKHMMIQWWNKLENKDDFLKQLKHEINKNLK